MARSLSMQVHAVDRRAIAVLTIACCAVVGAMMSGSCLSSKSFACGDARCPDGFQCIPFQETTLCARVGCGNGLREDPEVCDDGNNEDGDGCSWNCESTERCGDGYRNADLGEVCDDGNRLSGDGCSEDCLSDERCGNSYVDMATGEMCDDGNNASRDGCSLDCQSDERCGNGFLDMDVEAPELCDDGGDSLTCDSDCTPQVCGDGHINPAAGETCDDIGETQACDPDCTLALCGDGYINPLAGEICDDGGPFEIDACSSTCRPRTHVAAGHHHSCALLTDGRVRCWGDGGNGRLGYGTIDSIGDDELPLDAGIVDVGDPATQVVAGEAHTCALLATGAVRCWGQGLYGALGYGNLDDVGHSAPPAGAGDVDLGGRAVQVAAGASFTCALLDTGSVRCWGSNASGKLGYADDVGGVDRPVNLGDIELGGRASQIVTGGDHACALLDGGQVRCWGQNDVGQLGYGDSNAIGDDETPASVDPVDVGGAVIQIAAGSRHTCALLVAGTVRCWGAGEGGRLGYGDTADVGDDETPASAGDVDVGGAVIQIAAGGLHTCALLEGGQVRCWGRGGEGQLGYGNTEDIGDDETPASVDFVDVGGRVAQLSAGWAHVCAKMESHVVRCWGLSDRGQIGNGDQSENVGDDETPVGVSPVHIDDAFLEVVAGQRHICGRRVSGAVQCWGANSRGELGYGNTENLGDDEPLVYGDPAVDIGGRPIQLALGSARTCVLLDGGAVRCWGSSNLGPLGYGTTEDIGDDETPASMGDIDVGGPASEIVAGYWYTCALLEDGAVRCWGTSMFGELGYPNTSGVEIPASAGNVDVGGTVSKLATSGQALQTCAIMDTGAVRCWGNGHDALGYGNDEHIGDDETPATAGDIPLGALAMQVSVGEEHRCALSTTNAVRCWGAGFVGQLGYGNPDRIGGEGDLLPADAGEVPVGGNVVQVAAGAYHTCALLENGGVRCWGHGLYGQLGYVNTDNVGDDESLLSVGTVDVGAPVARLTAGGFFTCAFTDTAAIRCWGSGGHGQLGHGNTDNIGDDEAPASIGDIQWR